mgnify:CR=1 FL=1
MISFQNFSFRYEESKDFTLRGIDMTVRTGEFILLTGRSGCGKTTLIRSLNGLIPHFYPGEIKGDLLMDGHSLLETSVYKGYKQDKIEMRGDRAEMSDFPLYLNTVAGGLDCRDQTIGGFSFVVKIYAVPVVEIIG